MSTEIEPTSSVEHQCGGSCGHRSDCALHNEPAMPNRPCDCGGIEPAPPTSPPEACREAYPHALSHGEVIECEKTGRHWKHFGHDRWVGADGEVKVGDLKWWGKKLSPQEMVEADRIRELGGIDVELREVWLDKFKAEVGL